MDELVHKGHRQRMRRKFSEFGPRFFDTYELLEMLLYKTVAVKDTNPIAKKLLLRFGSLDGVLNAEISELTEVDGVGQKTAELIKKVGEAFDLCYCEDLVEDESLCFENYDELGAYIAEYMKSIDTPVQIMLSFNNNMKLIAIDKIYAFDHSLAATQPNKFLSTAVKRNASVVVIAHNHPYGPLCPTEGDRQTNIALQSALHNTGIFLLEHYVVCGTGYIGFMNYLRSHFSQKPSLEKFYRSKRISENG